MICAADAPCSTVDRGSHSGLPVLPSPGRGTASGYYAGSVSSSRCTVANIQLATARWSTTAASR
jgi:hypothetical protein